MRLRDSQLGRNGFAGACLWLEAGCLPAPRPPVCRSLGSWSLLFTSLVLQRDWFEITSIVQLMLVFPLKKNSLQRARCKICGQKPLIGNAESKQRRLFFGFGVSFLLSRDKEQTSLKK